MLSTNGRDGRTVRVSSLLLVIVFSTVIALMGVLSPVHAKELSEGFTLTAENLDENLQNTFQGHTIESLLTDVYEMRIRDQKLRMRLKKSTKLVMPEAWKEKTERYKGEVSYDPKTGTIQNYRAGVPFPGIEADDPNAGAKAYINSRLGHATPPKISHSRFYNTFVDGNNSIERFTYNTSQYHWSYNNYREPPREEVVDPRKFQRTLQFILAPQNLRGIGGFSINYLGDRIPSSWTYLRSLRRVRRTSGGNWSNKATGLGDFYNDGFGPVFGVHPNFYKSFKHLGKKWLLFPQEVHVPKGEKAPNPIHIDAESAEDRYHYLDLERGEPYWNLDPEYYRYEPRLVHVIKQTMVEKHDLGSRILYLDAKFWRIVGADEYDKNGDLVQQVEAQHRDHGTGGRLGPFLIGIYCYNFKANHATSLTNLKSYTNPPAITWNNISLNRLRQSEPVPVE